MSLAMGDNKCAYDGCNALEFRTSGYCLKHKDGPKTILISEVNPIKKEISEDIDMINSPNPKYNNFIWFPIGLFAGPVIAIIMIIMSEFLFEIGGEGIAVFSICVILPLIYIIGIVWGLRSNGPTGFSLGLLVTPLVFGLFVLFLIFIISEEGIFM
ncbi:MAG: hypothetical protein CMB47_03745 [Euryarchaeota archaeon]|nr:hypothetical protein [Euryarchaeota archaeon]